MEFVVLVDEHDKELGMMEKMEAHQKGCLHRAFSVFIFNQQGQLLLQQRASGKYHSPTLWTNSCCSHPRPNESVQDAASRRLFEELGFYTPLTKVFDFYYKAAFDNGLTEHEFDHVFVGYYDHPVQFNTQEVMNYDYRDVLLIEKQMQQNKDTFTPWFHIAFPKIKQWWESAYKHLVYEKE